MQVTTRAEAAPTDPLRRLSCCETAGQLGPTANLPPWAMTHVRLIGRGGWAVAFRVNY